jgi:hypothetical protein
VCSLTTLQENISAPKRILRRTEYLKHHFSFGNALDDINQSSSERLPALQDYPAPPPN